MVVTKRKNDKNNGYLMMVPAVAQGVKITLYLTQMAPQKVNLTDICKQVGIHKSKGLAILNTLRTFGFVFKEPGGKLYSLGPGLISLGRKAVDSFSLIETARPILKKLARETRGLASLNVIAGKYMFVVARWEPEAEDHHMVSLSTYPGHPTVMSHGAIGKAAVAFMSQEERENILGQKNLFFHGDPSRLDLQRLEQELSECRIRGYAEDIGEVNPKISSVAAPVFIKGNRIIGVLNVAWLLSYEVGDRYGSVIAEAGRQLSELLGAHVQKIQKDVTGVS
jgi:DNA-binding IclR family transcriptional regulator